MCRETIPNEILDALGDKVLWRDAFLSASVVWLLILGVPIWMGCWLIITPLGSAFFATSEASRRGRA